MVIDPKVGLDRLILLSFCKLKDKLFAEIVMDRVIVCIRRNAPPVDCTCITDVGTSDSDYLAPVSKVIQLIESGKDRFYVTDHKDGSRAYVLVAQREYLKYIRTRPNDTADDNLLKVGDCKIATSRIGIIDYYGQLPKKTFVDNISPSR